MRHLLTLGHGYCARAVSARVLAAGGRVTALVRDGAKAADLATQGVESVLWNPAVPDGLLEAAATATDILHSVSPAGAGDPFLGLADDLAVRATRLRWFGYLSTTGVYGDTQGAWVDEDAPLKPARDRSSDRSLAEAAWQETSLPLHIFRLSGIYGPGRGPFEKLRRGQAQRIVKAGQVFSRIHVEDIAQAVMLSMAQPQKDAVYNLCDDEPAAADVVLVYAAQLLGIEPPPAVAFEEADLSPMARSFYDECRRVRNDRIKAELGFAPLYPSYREGLAAILAAEGET